MALPRHLRAATPAALTGAALGACASAQRPAPATQAAEAPAIRFTTLETGGLSDGTAAHDAVGSPEVASCMEYPFVFQPVN